ncbi:hypothetical protein SRABI106_01847 [Rahnella aquatilis]|nr:hypothetical protein SRABI106_01847 [Rahnella aquatilis]
MIGPKVFQLALTCDNSIGTPVTASTFPTS